MSKIFQIDTGSSLTTSLVSYFKLENCADMYGSNLLTNFNTSTFATGKVNNAASFNGTTQYLQRANVLSAATNNFSMFMWVNIPTTSEKGCFAHNGLDTAGTTDGYSIGVGNTTFDNNGNNLLILLENVAWVAPGLTIGTGWHFVGVIRDAGTLTGYVDGVAGATTSTTAPSTPTGNFTVGASSPANASPRYWKDKIDELGFWTKALSSQERTDLYNGGSGQTMVDNTALSTETWNPSDKSANIALSNGNLTATSNAVNWHGVRGAVGLITGKYYWEINADTLVTAQSNGIAFSGAGLDSIPNNETADTVYVYNSDGNKSNGGSSATAYGATYTTGDVIGVAVDFDTGKIWFAKNNTWQASGNPPAGTNPAFSTMAAGTQYPLFSSGGNGNVVTANFGATTTTYEPPSGFIAVPTTQFTDVNYLNVAGGGSTTSSDPVGGGGGEVLTGTKTVYSGVPWTITVGAAGAKSYAFYTTARGGTAGGVSGNGHTVGANGTNSYGGGAGDSANGGNGGLQIGGAGGAGTSSSISGSSVEYGGGGGGSADVTGGNGRGGGGNGGASAAGTDGSANTGGGAGGCFAGSATGGTGVVIISVPQGHVTATGGTHTTSGGNDIWTFTTSGTWTPTVNNFIPTITFI